MFDSRPLSWCAEEVRRHDNDRFLAALFAPEPARESLMALYAFNLEVARVREAAREPLVGAIRLAWWRDAATAMFEDRASPRHPVADALRAAIARHGLPRAPFDRLLEARARDLEDMPHADMAMLVAYAEGTGATLAELALAALGVQSGAALVAARAVGTAWALVGIARAVPFHARAHRLYLPADALASARVAAETVFAGRAGPALAPIVRAIAEKASECLATARALRAEIDPAALPALLPAQIADGYLKRLARVGHDPFDPRLARPAPRRHVNLTVAAWQRRY